MKILVALLAAVVAAESLALAFIAGLFAEANCEDRPIVRTRWG